MMVLILFLFEQPRAWGKNQMRKMTTDRPDTIETPHSVDAGHFQIETSLFSYTHTAGDYSILPMLLKFGLLDWCDLELGLQPYVHTTASGFGDTLLRFKASLYGNDEGSFSIATIPFVVFPNEGGIIFPMELKLSETWSVALETEYNYAAEFINIISVAHDFTEKFGMFTEFFTQARHENNFPWVARFDTGFTYAFTENFVVDGAVNTGLTEVAEALNPFVGFSYRH